MGTSTDSTPVVVGSGLAGLTVARALAPERCILVTPDDLTAGAASMWAQGGIAAAIGEDDSPELHAVDTRRAGADLGDAGTIARITAAAPDVVRRLHALGVPFDLAADQALDLALEGGHSRRRIAHAGDRSGAAITRTVAGHVATLDSVEIHTGLHARRLVTDSAGKIAGLVLRAASGAEVTIDTDRIVLATGGLGGLFAHTTNPRTALGQGIAMASRVGARTDDLHFVQFHPTALDVGLDPMPLLTEALRGRSRRAARRRCALRRRAAAARRGRGRGLGAGPVRSACGAGRARRARRPDPLPGGGRPGVRSGPGSCLRPPARRTRRALRDGRCHRRRTVAHQRPRPLGGR
ncbi:FAD-binding protein [Allobranchiibius sp. GilTou73]|nr:FAD-binding protein [Allobranchiibius sp. GilTou73]UIJ34364.1 FAD-binding protein [Allobranchiibius sp. GilTou73]